MPIRRCAPWQPAWFQRQGRDVLLVTAMPHWAHEVWELGSCGVAGGGDRLRRVE